MPVLDQFFQYHVVPGRRDQKTNKVSSEPVDVDQGYASLVEILKVLWYLTANLSAVARFIPCIKSPMAITEPFLILDCH